MNELDPPRRRPCPGCPFRLTAEGREELLQDLGRGDPELGVPDRSVRTTLEEWACHEALAADPFEASHPHCAGAAILLGRKSSRGQPPVSLLPGQVVEGDPCE